MWHFSGAKPEFCTITLLGPRPTEPAVFQKIMKQTCKAADELDIAIVRGHTGMYDSLKELLGVCTVYGTVEPREVDYAWRRKTRRLNSVHKTAWVLETITNYSLTHPELAQKLFGAEKQRELAEQVKLQSCVKEAL